MEQEQSRREPGKQIALQAFSIGPFEHFADTQKYQATIEQM